MKTKRIKDSKNIWVKKNSLIAWEAINEAFIFKHGLKFIEAHNALYAYDLVLKIEEPYLDPDFDFGRSFNYTMAKWRSLVSNYIDYTELDSIKAEVKKAEEGKKVYNLALQFTNKHGHGKNCLLSMVFSRRAGDNKPTIAVFVRASEVTKRLICDFLLFQRIGEYIYGNETPFGLVIHFNQLFNDDTVLIMYHTHRDLFKLIGENTKERSKKLLELLDKLLKSNPETIKYKVHRRAAKVLHPEQYKYPRTLVKDCKLRS